MGRRAVPEATTQKEKRQAKFIAEFLANGRKVGKACKALGIATSTVRMWRKDVVFNAKLSEAENVVDTTRLDFYKQIIKDAEKCLAGGVKYDPETARLTLAALAPEVWDTVGKRQLAIAKATKPDLTELPPLAVRHVREEDSERRKVAPAPDEKKDAA